MSIIQRALYKKQRGLELTRKELKAFNQSNKQGKTSKGYQIKNSRQVKEVKINHITDLLEFHY
jgi:hypothetical protein